MLCVPSSGSMTPEAVSNTPTYAQKNPTRIKNVFMHHTSHHDRSAGRPWCWHSSSFLKHRQQHTVWPAKTLECLFLSAALPDSSSISFWPVSAIFLLCQSEVFHQSVCETTRRLFHVLICPQSHSSHFIHLASRTCAVNNSYKPRCWKTPTEARQQTCICLIVLS